MQWILDVPFHIYNPRGLFASKRGKHSHGGVDICAKMNSIGFAPENGRLILQWVNRNKNYKPTLRWSDDNAVHYFGAWCSHPYGGVAILYGESGNQYLFCHLELKQLQELAEYYGIKLKQELLQAGDRLAKVYHNLNNPIEVKTGDKIALVGNAGQSSEPHFHLERWNNNRRLDPLLLWSEIDFEQYYREV
jgi:hypothetical protein